MTILLLLNDLKRRTMTFNQEDKDLYIKINSAIERFNPSSNNFNKKMKKLLKLPMRN